MDTEISSNNSLYMHLIQSECGCHVKALVAFACVWFLCRVLVKRSPSCCVLFEGDSGDWKVVGRQARPG